MVSEEGMLCLETNRDTSEHMNKPISSPFLIPQHKGMYANQTEDNVVNITLEAILHFYSAL